MWERVVSAFVLCTAAVYTIPSAMGASTDEAQSCAPVDIRPKHQRLATYFSEPRDQNLVRWCSAFPAADLLSVELGIPVSATDLAITSTKKDLFSKVSRLFRKPGLRSSIDPAIDLQSRIKSVKNIGVCPDFLMPSDMKNDFNEGHSMISVFVGIQMKQKEISQGAAQFQACDPGIDFMRNYFPSLDPVSIYAVLKRTMDDSVIDSAYELAKEACKGRRIPIPKSLKIREREEANPDRLDKTIFPAIDAALMRSKPAAIGISKITQISRHERDGLHAMTVLARRYMNGKCQYLIRNSWGVGCLNYRNEALETCNSAQGTFWLSKESLRKAGLFRVTSF